MILLVILEVLCLGGLALLLNTNKEVNINIPIDRIKEIFNSFMCKILYKEVSLKEVLCNNVNNKYEEGTGLKFEALDESDSSNDDIKDFQMNTPAEDWFDCSEGMYGQFDDENLFSLKTHVKRVPRIKMDLQTLASPVEPIKHEYPPIIARHFFGIVEPV